MPVLADDDVIVHGNAERSGNVDDGAGHLDIGLRWRRVAGGVIMHQNDRGGRACQTDYLLFRRGLVSVRPRTES
jgi:hypothetical protein